MFPKYTANAGAVNIEWCFVQDYRQYFVYYRQVEIKSICREYLTMCNKYYRQVQTRGLKLNNYACFAAFKTSFNSYLYSTSILSVSL